MREWSDGSLGWFSPGPWQLSQPNVIDGLIENDRLEVRVAGEGGPDVRMAGLADGVARVAGSSDAQALRGNGSEQDQEKDTTGSHQIPHERSQIEG